MLMERKKTKVPHPSFDIDGDGGVSHQDYFFANLFDRNHDGVLDKDEREACLKALKGDYESHFLFGLDASAKQAGSNDPAGLHLRV